MRLVFFYCLLVVFYGSIYPPNSLAADDSSKIDADLASSFVDDLKEKAESIVDGSSNQVAAYKGLRQLIVQYVDLEGTAKFVAGESWDKLNQKQQKSFVFEYGRYVQAIYTRQLYKYATMTLNVLGSVKQSNGYYLVNTMLIEGSRDFTNVGFKLRKNGNSFYLTDVLLSGISLAINQRSKFSDDIQSKGIEGIMKSLVADNLKSDNSEFS